jgi:hypothetical protein
MTDAQSCAVILADAVGTAYIFNIYCNHNPVSTALVVVTWHEEFNPFHHPSPLPTEAHFEVVITNRQPPKLPISKRSTTEKSKGIFSWDKTVMDSLVGSTRLGEIMIDRQLCMVAYFFELGYDLMLSPKLNLSRMPGFEAFEAAGLIPFEKDN